MKKWAVFSDVDGTIYPFPSKNLTETVKKRCQLLKEENVSFFINTGNPPLDKIKKLATKLNSRYLICSNGALIYDNEAKSALHVEYMDKDQAKKIFDLSDKLNQALYYFGIDQYYLKNASKEVYDFLSDFCEYSDWITDGRLNDDLYKIEVYGTRDEIQAFYKEAVKLDTNLNIVNLNTHIEITNRGVSKASGMKWVCDNLIHADLKDVMAIGDSPNDISMLDAAGYSYAMENSDDLTRSHAKFFTSSVEQSGLAEAIDDYLYRSDYHIHHKK
ncbi:HAD family hydrolase [Mycoplasmopsis synoviae]|uniref:Cof-type HAD-IIB family hydrolase n=1 Tax=Mycoplasmopsis synoviae TaxID=2109 RepID=UPI00349F0194